VKILTALFVMLLSLSALSGTAMKLEGNCSGKTSDKSPISFSYYSDFNGCKNISHAAISFSGERSELLTGRRSLRSNHDHYNFANHAALKFKNSTGNTSGILKIDDETIHVQCEIRDYEYAEC